VKNDVTISVVISSYNQKKYLIEAITSVLNQTYKPHEIIIADDCSTDDSVQCIRGFIEENPEIIIGVFNKKNVGIPKNRNSGLEKVTGDYVIFLDGDDILLPECLERFSQELKEYPDSCIFGNQRIVGDLGMYIKNRFKVAAPSGIIFPFIGSCEMGIIHSLVAPTALVKKIGGLNSKFPKHDGYIYTLQLSQGSQFIYIDEPVMDHRDYSFSDSKSFSKKQALEYLSDVYEKVSELMKNVPAHDKKNIEIAWNRKINRVTRKALIEEIEPVTA